jgi:4-hydroxyphenylpyruvate dioxygenase
LYRTPLPFYSIDHVVEAHEEGTIDSVTEWYNKTLKMQRFWSIDDRSVHTEFSALKAVLTGNDEKSVKITVSFLQ